MPTCQNATKSIALLKLSKILYWIGFLASTTSYAFHTSIPFQRTHARRLCHFSAVDSSELSFDQWAASTRSIGDLDKWACENGVKLENGFQLVPTGEDGQDWNVQLTRSAAQSDRVVYIPSHLILSGARIENELKEYDGFHAAVSYVKQRNCEDELPQFFLWIKILQEFEKGNDSLWHSWLRSLPRQFDMAIYYDDVEMECLPPYAWSLAKLQRHHLEAFQKALKLIPSCVTEQTLTDRELARWALSVVFTRCWGKEGDGTDKTDKTCHIAPLGDMLNHGDPACTFIDYDNDGNCNIFLKRDVEARSALSLSYGRTTNPSRFLVLYGFIDTNQSEIFSQILVTNPSQKHKDLGYDVSKMVFSTQDGSIAEEVFDVTLYSILEQAPELQAIFYAAHTKGDKESVKSLRTQYQLEICVVLKKHVDGKLMEFSNLLQKMDSMYNDTICQDHPRLSMIYDHNKFLYFTFASVRSRLDKMIQDEMKRRKIASAAVM